MSVTYTIAILTIAAGVALPQNSSTDRKKQAADRASESPGSTSSQLSTADKNFVVKAAEGGMAEVEVGKLAQERGSSTAVKDYGKRLVDDHTKANDELKQVVASKGVNLPAEVKGKEKAELDKLSKASGAAFDKAFARQQVADHKKDIAEFEREANNGQDPDIKAFATKTLPTLKEHLRMAQDLTKNANASGSSR